MTLQKPKTPFALTHQMGELGARISGAQQLMLMTIGFIAVTIGLGIVFIQIPWQEARKQLASERREEIERAELLLSLHGTLNHLKDKEKTALLEGGAPVLTSEVTRAAAKGGLEIESVTPRDDTPLGPYTKFQIEVLGSTSPERLMKFLQILEQHRPLLILDELEIGALKGSGNTFSGFYPLAGSGRPAAEPFEPTPEQKIRLTISAFSRTKPKP